MVFSRDGVEKGWFGEGYTYTGATIASSTTITFSSSNTPIIESVSPARAMPGQLINLYGQNLGSGTAVTDTNW